jgi:hypothetical protein
VRPAAEKKSPLPSNGINVIINITDLADCELAGDIIYYLIRNDLLRIVNNGMASLKLKTPWLSPLTGLISVGLAEHGRSGNRKA